MDSNKRSISHNILSPAQEHRKGNDCETNTPEKHKKHHVQEKRSTETTKKTNDSGDNQHRFFYFKMMNDMQDAYIIGRKNALRHQQKYAHLIEKQRSFPTQQALEYFKDQQRQARYAEA